MVMFFGPEKENLTIPDAEYIAAAKTQNISGQNLEKTNKKSGFSTCKR